MWAPPAAMAGGTWKGKRKVRFTSTEGVALAWLRQHTIQSMDTVRGRFN